MFKIREARKQAGFTQKELAARIDVSESTINRYESGAREPNYETLLKIAEVTNTSMAFLAGAADVKKENPAILEGFSESEIALIQLFRMLTPENQRSILATASAFVDSQVFHLRQK